MTADRRGAVLAELLVALTVLGVGLAPSAWVFARAERLVAEARARERVAASAAALLVRLEGGAACASAGASGEADGVAAAWTAAPDSLRTVVAVFRAAGGRGPDTLVTAAWCP